MTTPSQSQAYNNCYFLLISRSRSRDRRRSRSRGDRRRGGRSPDDYGYVPRKRVDSPDPVLAFQDPFAALRSQHKAMDPAESEFLVCTLSVHCWQYGEAVVSVNLCNIELGPRMIFVWRERRSGGGWASAVCGVGSWSA